MPRAGLTTLRVTEQAEDIADEVGLSNLTLAAVAARLGVRLPSLYKHVDGMDALQRLVAIRAKTELAAVLGQAAVGKAGTDALRAMSVACRAWALRHPGRYAATVRAPEPADAEHTSASNAIISVAFAVLTGYNLAGDDAVDAVRALRATLHGFITLEQAGGFGLPADVERSFDRLVAGLSMTLSTYSGGQPPTSAVLQRRGDARKADITSRPSSGSISPTARPVPERDRRHLLQDPPRS